MDSSTLRLKLLTVPNQIRQWIGSEDVTQILEKIDAHFHIVGENQRMVSRSILRLEIKDLEPHYFAGELASILNLEKDRALSLAEEIRKNILVPIKNDLAQYGVDISELGKFNLPILKIDKSTGGAPTPIRDISSGEAKSMMTPTSAPKPLSTISTVIPSPAPAAPIAKISTPSEGKFAPVAKLSPLPQTGWSKMTTTEPPKFAPGTPIIPKPAVTPTPTPTPSSASTGPKPIILHEDATFKSTDKATDFHLSKPGQGAEVSLEGVKSQQTVKSAILELGTLGKVDQKPAETSPKLTHYTEFSARLTPVGTANTTGRDVTEITAKPVSATPTVTPVQTTVAPVKTVATAPSAPAMPTSATKIPSPSEGKFAPSAISPYAPAAPKPSAPQPQSQPQAQSRPPQPPQPPKPPQPPASPDAKVIQRNYP